MKYKIQYKTPHRWLDAYNHSTLDYEAFRSKRLAMKRLDVLKQLHPDTEFRIDELE